MDLFEFMEENNKEKDSPLAKRLRPTKLSDIVGQEHILSPDKLLYKIIMADKLSSLILYGPPGTGKTTIASVIACTTKADFLTINATTSGKKEIQDAIDRAKLNMTGYNKKTILFIDEIHRFNKAQQDYLLPFVEDGLIILIGATTENPYFEVNKALLSRSFVYELYHLLDKDIKKIVKRALSDKEKGLGLYKAEITDNALDFLSRYSAGDARYALNTIEIAVLTTQRNNDKLIIDETLIAQCMGKKPFIYDKNSDNHYDIISAFIKSMRGSDPNATIYYLARMIEAGEDVNFIARRIMICAAEDVGNADPYALILSVAAADAVNKIGFPESRIILSQAAIYVATAKKSNSAYKAINSAIDLVNKTNYKIPAYLRSEGYKKISDDEMSKDYKYPHDYENNYVNQRYLPEEIANVEFYKPTKNTREMEYLKRFF